MASPAGTAKAHGPSLESKKAQLLDLLYSGLTVSDALAALGWNENYFYKVRRVDRDFDAQVKEHTSAVGTKGKWSRSSTTYDPDRLLPPLPPYADFVRTYFGRPTAAHHQTIADTCLTTTNRRVLVLAPPGAGKDTTLGHCVFYRKVADSNYTRVTWIMESQTLALRRVGERIEPYLTNPQVYLAPPADTPGATTPTRSLIDDYGPFKHSPGLRYPDGTPVRRSTWSKREGYRFLRSSRAPEADPDLQAVGIDGDIYGTRIQLLVCSDLFTRENQVSPDVMDGQLDFVMGTLNSRLDAKGVAWVIGTRCRVGDNYERLLDKWVPDGVEIYTQTHEGPIVTTRYTNGVVVVVIQAIWIDERGEEHSYWPERFPLDDCWEDTDGNRYPFDAFSIADADLAGLTRVQGLRSIRAADPELFETIYQQAPPASTAGADFSPEVLDLCLDATRSYGYAFPDEELHLIIDPARTGGAAYVVLAVDYTSSHITVIDAWWGKNLGINGIKQRLVLTPAATYHPAYVVYEGNHEQGIMYDTEIQTALRNIGAVILTPRTGDKRNDPVVGIASVQREMRRGQVSFPAATATDRAKSTFLRQHFLNWEGTNIHIRKPRGGREATVRPDDLAMATSIGILHIRALFERRKSSADRPRVAPSRPIPRSIARRWDRRGGKHPSTRRDPYHGVDIDALVNGDFDSDLG